MFVSSAVEKTKFSVGGRGLDKTVLVLTKRGQGASVNYSPPHALLSGSERFHEMLGSWKHIDVLP